MTSRDRSTQDVSENYKNNLVKKTAREKMPGTFALFFQKTEDPFFLGNRLLFSGYIMDILHMLGRLGFGFLPHIFCNKREMGIAFLGNANLLVMEHGLCRNGRLGSGNSEGGGHIVPWFPVGIRDHEGWMGFGRSPLRNDNRCIALRVCCMHARSVERRPAAVAEKRCALGIGSPAGRAGVFPDDRFLSKRGAAAGAEARLGIDGRVAAGAAYHRQRLDFCPAPVAELCQFIGNNRAAPHADRECQPFLFRHGSAAPVAELCLVVEPRVAAFTTFFCHVLQ
jgi:hypothetical protein